MFEYLQYSQTIFLYNWSKFWKKSKVNDIWLAFKTVILFIKMKILINEFHSHFWKTSTQCSLNTVSTLLLPMSLLIEGFISRMLYSIVPTLKISIKFYLSLNSSLIFSSQNILSTMFKQVWTLLYAICHIPFRQCLGSQHSAWNSDSLE